MFPRKNVHLSTHIICYCVNPLLLCYHCWLILCICINRFESLANNIILQFNLDSITQLFFIELHESLYYFEYFWNEALICLRLLTVDEYVIFDFRIPLYFGTKGSNDIFEICLIEEKNSIMYYNKTTRRHQMGFCKNGVKQYYAYFSKKQETKK